jgi:hypothetical protein
MGLPTEDDHDELDKTVYSHPDGLPVAPKSGRCRTLFPLDGSDVPEFILMGYGEVLIIHRRLESGQVEQEFTFISGIGHRALGPRKFSYEVTSLKTWNRSSFKPAAVSKLEQVSNWKDPLMRFKSGDYQSLERHSASISPTLSPSSVASLSATSEWVVLLVGAKLDLTKPSSFVGIPRYLLDGKNSDFVIAGGEGNNTESHTLTPKEAQADNRHRYEGHGSRAWKRPRGVQATEKSESNHR